ncbi:MAG: DUF1570 domain-containing protein, partial [Gemmataceae bacterium]
SASSAGGKTALLHRTFRVPPDAAVLRFKAAAFRAGAGKPGTLDIVLEAPGREYLPRLTLKGGAWEKSDAVGPADGSGGLREYIWQVDQHAGKRVRIALVDEDGRPGCHLVCSGFEVTTRDGLNARHFEDAMLDVHRKSGVPAARRFDSKRFFAFSNAGRAFTEDRLQDCELIHDTFFRHFRRKGFDLREPAEKLMVAVFSTQRGFDAYLGQSLGPHVTGMYHTPTNRLVVYDYATNSSFLTTKKGADDAAKRGTTDLDRRGKSVTYDRILRDRRDDVNVSTVMHEVAHQLSFNAGLFNRHGDVPAWLAEGLAVYCESTSSGVWQGIGEPIPSRAAALRGRPPVRLRSLVENDDWLRKSALVEDVVAGYSASWLLFRLLIEERPRQLKMYLEAIHPRRGPEHRLADFAGAFGDLKKLEKRYEEYVAANVARGS